MAVGRADPEVNHSPYVHPDSGNTGNEWMNGKISFAKMKITNSKDQRDGNVSSQLLIAFETIKLASHLSANNHRSNLAN